MPRFDVLMTFDGRSGIGGEINADNATQAAREILQSWDHPRMSHNLVGYDQTAERDFRIRVRPLPADRVWRTEEDADGRNVYRAETQKP